MSEEIKGFKDLRIWKSGVELVVEVYKATAVFPKTEVYGLAAQMQRAAVSVPSNIAEGFRRKYTKEYKRYLIIALGSCGELETQLIIAKKLEYLSETVEKNLSEELDHLCRMIQALITKLGRD